MNKPAFFSLRIAATLFSLLVLIFSTPLSFAGNVRQPAVAGTFYPEDPKELQKMVDDFIARANPPQIEGRLMALVSPHAGYIYSGPVAGFSYALLKGRKFQRVVIIAPSHYEAFLFSSVYDGDAYVTPLGTVPVDRRK